MRKFQLHRFEENGGTPGFNIVGEGVCFDSHHCVVRWFGEPIHLGFFESPENIEKHVGAKTKLVWIAEMVNEGSRKSIAEMLQMAVLRLHNGDDPEEVADYLSRMVRILDEPKSRPRLGDKP